MSARAAAFEAVKKQAVRLEHSPYSASRTFNNIALYLLLADRDISSAKLDALTHPDPWRRSLATRTILLVVHEWDVDKVTGHQLRNAMEQVEIPDELRREVVSALRGIRSAQERARKAFKALRNATIAHRDPDALAQYRAIRDVRTDRVMEIVADFYASSQRFIALLPRLIVIGSDVGALLRQFLSKDR